MKTNYIILSYELSEELQDLFIGLISDYDFIGIEQVHDIIRITFAESKFNENLSDEIFGIAQTISKHAKKLETISIEEQNWNKDWEESIEPVWINSNFVITPEWKAESLDAQNKIIINPKMSFGTGHHATTKMMAQLALKCVKNGQFWIDAGSGTGVLAIIASKLGASDVFAFDNDEWSIDNINENIKNNNITNISVAQGDVLTIDLPPTDGIFANLFLNLVLDSLPKFFNSLKHNNGDLLVSGILKYDGDIVIKEAFKAGFRLIERLNEDEWIAFHFKAE